MAKKDPTDLTVEEKLKALYQLQTTLSAIDEKRALRGELPLEVQDLEDDIAGLTTRIEKIQTDIEQFDRAIDQKQHEIEDAQASVERYKKQLEMVSNNREYDTLSKEIEFQELEIELCSKKIREAQQMINERLYDLHKAEDQKADREKGLVMKRSELESIMAETREEEENLKEKAFELEKKIEPRLLQSFKRIRNGARNGLGIVYVQRDACGGCFNSSTSRCTRRLSLVSIVAVSSSTQNWLVLRLRLLRLMRSQSASALSAEERLRMRIKRYNEGSPKLLGEPLFFCFQAARDNLS